MLRICLLGPFRVERDGEPIPRHAWARPKDRALLALLALERGHLVPQDRLLDSLWPDLAPAAATNSLHVAISRLRKLLASVQGDPAAGAHLVQHGGVGYRLAADGPFKIDLEEFRGLVDRARAWQQQAAWMPAVAAYRAADALYRGDLLEDEPYAEWALGPREQLRELHLTVFEQWAVCLVQQSAPAEAVDVCERGLAQEPMREGLYVQLMRAHAAAGHLAEALQVYERCRRALADELGVDPGPAVQAIHAQVLRDERPSAALAPTGPPARPLADRKGQLHLPCVGRERELAFLAARLGEAQAGRGQLVLVHGEPGIGKSRLLEEFGRLAESRGGRQLTARCYELERDLPYAPIVDALGSFVLKRVDPAEVPPALGRWGPQLAALIPILRELVPDLIRHQALRPDAERSALLAGLTHLLVALSRRTCLALLVDDLQWADASTVQWLHYLARRLGSAAVLIVGAYRTGEVGPDHPLQLLLEILAGDPSAQPPLELSCLSDENVAALLPALSGLAARLHRETDGHPLFLVETVRTLLETGVLRLDEQGRWEASDPAVAAPERRLPLPPNLLEAIRWRVRRLNEQERRVLMAAAVVGRGFRPEVLARMTELALDTVLDAFDALVGRQFVRLSPAGSGFDFRHDLIQQVVYADLTPDRRRTLHGRAASGLQAWAEARQQAPGEAAGELAYHWREAELWAPAFRSSVLAGDHAREAFAPREALAHYQRATEIAEQQPAMFEPADRVGLVERLGRAHADLGELDAAIQQFEALRDIARALGDRLLEGRALLALADASFFRHAFEPAERLAAEALGRAEELADRGLRAGSLATAASVAMARGRTREAERHCGAVLTLAGHFPPVRGGEDPVVAGARLNALGWLGLLRELQGDHERAMPAIEASLRLGTELHNPFLTGRSRFALGMSLGNRGHYEEALTVLYDALRLAEEGGDRYFLPRLPNTIGWVYSELGDLRQAEEWNRRSIALARETGWLEAEANALVNQGSDALRAGHRSEAREHFERAAALIDRDEWFTWRYRMRLLVALGELALLDGRPDEALAFAMHALALAEPTGSRKHAGRAWLLSGRANLAAGAPLPEVLTRVERAQALARASACPPLVWSSAGELATLHTRLGHDVEAAACRAEVRAAIDTVADSIRDSALRRTFLKTHAMQRALADA